MKNIFGKIICTLALSLALSSCDLNLFPEATQVYDPEKPYYTQLKDVESTQTSIYIYFRSVSGTYASDFMFDAFNLVNGIGNNYGDLHRCDETFTSSSSTAESLWAAHYSAIKNYNIAIEAAENAENESFYNYAQFVKAEALIARAYSYLTLARHFGPAYDSDTAYEDYCVPLVLKYDQKERPHRASMEEVYSQIAEDLSLAREIMMAPESKKWLNSPVAMSNYFTTDVISFLEARMLLDTQEYKAAADTAVAIIKRKTYSLSSSAEKLKEINSSDTGTEAIMQCYASKSEGSKSYGVFLGLEKDGDSETGFSYKPYFLPSQKLMDSYSSSDYRRVSWFEQSGTTSGTHPIKNEGSMYSNIFLFTKYKGNAALSASGLEEGLVASKPFLIGELYLIAAEGYYKSNQNSLALHYLTELQKARSAVPVSEITDANLQLEWFKETVGEGLRLSCLKRWNKGFNGRDGQERAVEQGLLLNAVPDLYLNKVMEADDYHLCWPIPYYEIQCNSNLEKEQNFGYSAE